MKYFLLVLLVPLFSFAQQTTKRPLSLTLSGGVSLAAYETGFLYYLTKQLHDHQMSDLKIVTGASAGSINSVVAVINACSPNLSSPQKSVNWRAWIPLGIRDIVDPSKVTSLSLFSREGVGKYSGLLRQEFLSGLREDCEVVLGLAVTRRVPLKVEIKPGLTTDRHNEFFLLKIKGMGAGKAPLIENFPLNEPGQNQLFLPLAADPEKNYDQLESVFVASAQFPLAFPPFPLTYCDLDSTAKKDACTAERTQITEFIDGGIFNNTPISLASTIAERFLNKKDRANLIYTVVTLDGSTHPVPEVTEQSHPSIFNYAMDLLIQFTETSRNRSVSESYLNKNGILNQTYSNDKLLPRSSQYYFAFSGFLDRGFREYDFYLGMYEARHFFDRFIEKTTSQDAKRYLSAKIEAEYQELPNPEWQPYFCFLETYERDPKAKGACASVANLRNFSTLIQVNSEIVKNRCNEAGKAASTFRSCTLAKSIVPRAPILEGESDQKFFYRRLEELKYPYELGKSRAASGEDILRAQVEPLFKVLVKQQPAEQRFILREASSILLNSLDFRPQNKRTGWALGSHLQYTRGRMLNDSTRRPWFFGEYGLMLRGLDTYVNSNPDAIALGPFAGITMNWTDKRTFWLEPEVGFRGGYNFSFKEDRSVCEAQDSFQASLYCRSLFVQPHASVSVLGKIRVELGTIVYLDKHYKNDFTMLAEVRF